MYMYICAGESLFLVKLSITIRSDGLWVYDLFVQFSCDANMYTRKYIHIILLYMYIPSVCNYATWVR